MKLIRILFTGMKIHKTHNYHSYRYWRSSFINSCVPQCNNVKQWLMKTNPGIFTDIKAICNFFGNGICLILPGFHSITGCDISSFPFGVGKISPFKKMSRLNKTPFLQDVGKNIDSFKRLDKPTLFYQTILYWGKENETFVSTRKRLCKSQKYKNSSRLIPDTHSADEHLKQADLQTFIWIQCMENIIEYPDLIDRGWQASTEGLCPRWYSCEQLSPSITDKSQNIKTGRSMFQK